ncbi:D-alanyl-D-alanine carboxypeptidase family protein [Terrilactibacillus sp. S3-3]|nr:D-alanyl-D-alanine carboxypeptidase family protein [Terrilactibacillus sp. S3-3]
MTILLKRTACIIICFCLCLPLFPASLATGAGISVSARAAVLMDQSSGRVLFENNSHQKMPIASITKVMTTILAIESGKMNRTFKVSGQAFGKEGSSIYLKKGEKIKLKDLVYGLMLRSGNDAAVAIAEAVGKSESGFVFFMMNEKAREIGMHDTHFDNPNGLDSQTHYSTAYDMALLTKYAMENPEFRKIFKTKIYRASETNKENARVWKNKNKLLYQYPPSTGGKTGFTKIAGRTLISTASDKRLHLIAVTLNDGNDWRDHKNLFNWAFANYKMVKIVNKGEVEGNVAPFYKHHLFTARALSIPLTAKESSELSTELTLIKPPKKKKWKTVPSPVGRLSVEIGSQRIAHLPLFYNPPKEKKKKLPDLFCEDVCGRMLGTG